MAAARSHWLKLRSSGSREWSSRFLRGFRSAMETFVAFNTKGKELGHEAREEMAAAKAEHGQHVDFGAYRTSHNPQFTGWKPACPPIYYGKVWGFDSSNMQGCLNPIGYYKRLYYAGDAADMNPNAPRSTKPRPLPSTLARSASAPTVGGNSAVPDALAALRASQSSAGLPPSTTGSTGYDLIRERFEPEVMNKFKPALFKKEEHEPLTFHNTLAWKYNTDKAVKLRMQELPKYKYPSVTHRSTPNELKFIQSLYRRTDTECLDPHPMKRVWGDG